MNMKASANDLLHVNKTAILVSFIFTLVITIILGGLSILLTGGILTLIYFMLLNFIPDVSHESILLAAVLLMGLNSYIIIKIVIAVSNAISIPLDNDEKDDESPDNQEPFPFPNPPVSALKPGRRNRH